MGNNAILAKLSSSAVAEDLAAARETFWENPSLAPAAPALSRCGIRPEETDEAEARLLRFAPFLRAAFPETAPQGGLIESPLTEIPHMRSWLEQSGHTISGRLFLKRDSDLPIAGSVKARGGIYEILKHSEQLAMQGGLLQPGDSYEQFSSPAFREFFRQYAIHVGSTGNLGLSIGIISAALGYRVTVHMSADAKQWKKDLLRAKGVTVQEYAGDYSLAVKQGRALAAQDARSYFVDDENSRDLFLGYAVAARRLKRQLEMQAIPVDAGHPLLVLLPCGVGGAPGGITFGLKQTFGDCVHCFLAEPVQSPCMLLGMATGLHHQVCVQDIGLTGRTAADGLAVGRPSGFVGKTVQEMVSGIFTVEDDALFADLRGLWDTERLFIEPSACAALDSAGRLESAAAEYFFRRRLTGEQLEHSCCIAWATGGSLVPVQERQKFLSSYSR
jgi:D-serine dehydratase